MIGRRSDSEFMTVKYQLVDTKSYSSWNSNNSLFIIILNMFHHLNVDNCIRSTVLLADCYHCNRCDVRVISLLITLHQTYCRVSHLLSLQQVRRQSTLPATTCCKVHLVLCRSCRWLHNPVTKYSIWRQRREAKPHTLVSVSSVASKSEIKTDDILCSRCYSSWNMNAHIFIMMTFK